MTIRAKMRVDEIREHSWGPGQEMRTIVLHPVHTGDEEDEAFWKATPAGKLELGCVNVQAVAHVKLNQTYYVDLTPVPAKE